LRGGQVNENLAVFVASRRDDVCYLAGYLLSAILEFDILKWD